MPNFRFNVAVFSLKLLKIETVSLIMNLFNFVFVGERQKSNQHSSSYIFLFEIFQPDYFAFKSSHDL